MGNRGEGDDDRGTATGRPTASERATGGTAVMPRPPLVCRPRGREAFAAELELAAAESRRAGDEAVDQYARSIPSRRPAPVRIPDPLGWDFGNPLPDGLESPRELVMPPSATSAGLDLPELYRLVDRPRVEDPRATVADAWKMHAAAYVPPFQELPETIPLDVPVRYDQFPAVGNASMGSAMTQLRRLTVSGLEGQLRAAGIAADFGSQRAQPLLTLVQGIAYCGPGVVALFETNGKLWRNVFERPAVSVDAVPAVKPGVYLHAAIPKRQGDRGSAIDFFVRLDGAGGVVKRRFGIDTRPNTSFFKRSINGGTVIVIAKSYWDRKGLLTWARALPYRLWETVKDSIRYYLLPELKDRALALTDPRAVAQFIWGFVKSKIPGVRALDALEDLDDLARVMVMASRGTNAAETGDINVAARLLAPLVANEIVGQIASRSVRGVARMHAKVSPAKAAAPPSATPGLPRATGADVKGTPEASPHLGPARPQVQRVTESPIEDARGTGTQARGVPPKDATGITPVASSLTVPPAPPAPGSGRKRPSPGGGKARAKARTQGAVSEEDAAGGKFKLSKGDLWRLGVFGKTFGSRTRSQRPAARRVEQALAIEGVLAKLRAHWDVVAEGAAGRIADRLKAGVQVKTAVRESFGAVRRRFWRSVYVDPELRDWLKRAGLHFLADETRNAKDRELAPYLMYRKGDGTFVRIAVDVDHEARLTDAPDAALDGRNLRLTPPRENQAVLEAIRRLDLFQGSDPDGHPEARTELGIEAAGDIDRAIGAIDRWEK